MVPAEILHELEDYAARERVPILNEGGRRVYLELLKAYRPRRVLEVGTAIGYSALLALACVADVEILTIELDAARAALARENFARAGVSSRVRLLVGNAGELLPTLAGETFDFIFLDAAKGQYPDYFRKTVPLLARGGVIVADNVLFRGYVRSTERPPRRYRTIVKRLREYLVLTSTPPFTTEIFARGDGLALTRRMDDDEKA